MKMIFFFFFQKCGLTSHPLIPGMMMTKEKAIMANATKIPTSTRSFMKGVLFSG